MTDSTAGFAALQEERKASPDNEMEPSTKYAKMVEDMRRVFDSCRTKQLPWRRRQLEALIKGIQENHQAIGDAIQADLGGSQIRPILDMAAVIGDAQFALSSLKTWTTPQKRQNDSPILDFQKTYVVKPEPKGVTLNIAPWNFPVALSLQPLIPALAAGNCMVIKPSELTPNCAKLVQSIVEGYLDQECVKVIQGAVPETTALLAQQWDHIFYTGNGCVGRIVMEAAAKHLTPLTLELGGKSPVLVDSTADMTTVVNRVFAGKILNQGQVCVSPDYVFIDETRCDEFLKKLTSQAAMSDLSVDNPKWGKIVNTRHVERLRRLLDTSGGEVVCGGVQDIDIAAQHMPFTVIKNVDLDSPIMREEIFGPILPVIPLKNMYDGIKHVKKRDRPLALYIFSQDKGFTDRVIQECPSGGVSVNSTVEQILTKGAPFGGSGASGFGKYHGKDGFDEFSHHRTIMYKSGSAPFLPPPEKLPDFAHHLLLKVMVTGFIQPRTKRLLKLAFWSIVAFIVAWLGRRIKRAA